MNEENTEEPTYAKRELLSHFARWWPYPLMVLAELQW